MTGLLAVGAASFDNSSEICGSSSRGPTFDLRARPDIVGGVSTCEYGAEEYWRGTGETVDHVAGLTALVKQRYPNYTPQQVAGYLKDNAESRSAEDDDPGPGTDANSTWGHGFAMLPDDVGSVTPPTVDTCFTTIDGSDTFTGAGTTRASPTSPLRAAQVTGTPASTPSTLTEAGSVSVTLSSDEDTYLYLMEGEGKSGDEKASNDDISSGNTNSQIPVTQLETGTYTIEATTYHAETTGNFTLVVEIQATSEPPEPDAKYIAISSGANHVCAIATDGSIMCWVATTAKGRSQTGLRAGASLR